MFRETGFWFIFCCFREKSFFVFILSFFLAAQFCYSQNAETRNSSDATALEAGKAIERELAGGEKHFYQITLAADQCAKLIVRQRGIDAVIREESASAKMIETDFDPRLNGVETIDLTSRAPVIVTIVVAPKQKNAAKGVYQINLEEIRAANARDFALDEARRLNWEAVELWRADKYDEALPLARRALEIRERELGAEHPEVGSVLVTVANQYSDKGDYQQAETLFLRALAIKEKAFGKDDFSLASILNNLGLIYKYLGNYVKAETVHERGLKIREKTLEPNHLLIASTLLNLGNISYVKSDLIKAAAYYQRVLEIREKALGSEDPQVATVLNNLANIYSDIDADITKSETLYLRALKIREKAFGENNPQVAETLHNLALLYANSGDLSKALAFGQRSIAAIENSVGWENPLNGTRVDLLATIYKNLGNYAQAESLYQKAVAIRKKTESDFHPHLGGIYTNLASLHALKGEIEKAVFEQTRANTIFEFNTALNLTTGSEREKLEYVKSLRHIEDKTLTLGFQFAPESKEAARLSATFILQRKGRVLDAVSDSLNALRRRFEEPDRLFLDNLNRINKEITELVANDSAALSAAEKEARIKTLTEERERLETEITRRASGFFEKSKPLTLADVQASIPANAALLEFTVYQPASMVSITDYDGRAPHYAVFVIGANELKWRDLGETKAIDDAVTRFRQALRDPKNKEVEKLGRALDERIMQPVRALLGDARHLLVSPDGELNLIPFEALVSEKGRFLVEDYSFTYLTSGRDLLRLQTRRDSKSKPLVIANPVFGMPVVDTAVKKDVPRNRQRSLTAARDLNEIYFTPLSGTAQEARSIRQILPDAEILTEARATESALKKVTAPRILHIATHGFFLADANQTASQIRGGQTLSSLSSADRLENPLLRSGLAFANANSRQDQSEDGILTALEASGLNLWGTKLVVLSACDTGLGEVKNGEGVYGLRRAFVLAGAESMVMSLWAVRDFVTSELMSDYYRHLKAGKGRGAAWRAVQLEMLKRADRRHPFYWASFIQSGEWANLDGSR